MAVYRLMEQSGLAASRANLTAGPRNLQKKCRGVFCWLVDAFPEQTRATYSDVPGYPESSSEEGNPRFYRTTHVEPLHA